MPPRKKQDKHKEDVVIENTYKTKIRYQCPKRGWVEEEVEVKCYKAAPAPKDSSIEIETLELADEELS